MDHLYNIVWADDNIQALLEDSSRLFEERGMKILPFIDAQSAIDYIKNNSMFVDGIIIDAKFSKNGEVFKEDEKSFPGLSVFMQTLSSLRTTFGMPYPCWIYTGYGDLLRYKYDDDDLAVFEDVIDKKCDYDDKKEWLDKMCSKIAETRTEEFKIRQVNADLFTLCTDKYLGHDCGKTLFDILAYNGENETDPFNPFRDILEAIMELIVKEGIIDNKTARTAINERIDKLSAAKRGQLLQHVIPSLKLLLVSSSLSHHDTKEKEALKNGNLPYMYETLLNVLKTVLVWLKSFIDENRACRYEAPEGDHIMVLDAGTKASSEGTEEGVLTVARWSVKLVNGEYASVFKKNLIPRSSKPGTRLRVRLEQDEKGRPTVSEIVSVL